MIDRRIGVFFRFALIVLCIAFGAAAGGWAHAAKPPAPPNVEIHVYSQPGCPFCRSAKAFLKSAQKQRPWMKVVDHDIESSTRALREFEGIVRSQKIDRPGVPLIVIGAFTFIGFDGPATTGTDLIRAAETCRSAPCRNLRGEIVARIETPNLSQPGLAGGGLRTRKHGARIPESIEFPLLGQINTTALSLPVLTVVLAAVDGFNPCAMWVLVFLIGLLLGMKDRTKMWILGGAFLLTSAMVYFVFLAAWLNMFLLLGTLFAVRLLVGCFAFVAGLMYLHDFAQHSEAYCRITNTGRRQRIMDAARRVIEDDRFYYALGGIVVLAAAVNLIELLCSAGLPAVFANVLSMSELPVWQYYAYLVLYISVFLLDDMVIFVSAMLTLHATGMTTAYSRYSHLIGGLVMVAIGVLLIFKPQWLSFG